MAHYVYFLLQIIPLFWDFKFSRLPDDGGSTHFWNVGVLQRGYTAQHPRRLYSSFFNSLLVTAMLCLSYLFPFSDSVSTYHYFFVSLPCYYSLLLSCKYFQCLEFLIPAFCFTQPFISFFLALLSSLNTFILSISHRLCQCFVNIYTIFFFLHGEAHSV
jgi:hypothetical protein